MPTNGTSNLQDFFSAVLFDMDGTLVDSEPMWLISEKELMGRYGVQWTQEDQSYCLGGPLDRVGRYMSDLAKGAESGPYFTQEIIALMAQRLSTGAPIMPGAQELMNELRQLSVPMALVSASPRVLVDAVLSNFLDHPFEISISSSEVTKTKPDPEGYIKAAKALNVDISNCLILEDSATGVSAAQNSGAFVLAIPHLVPIQPNSRTHIVDSLEVCSRSYLEELYQTW